MFTVGIFLFACLFVGNEAAELRGASFGIEICSISGNCQLEETGIVIDYAYTGCTNPRNCYNVSAY